MTTKQTARCSWPTHHIVTFRKRNFPHMRHEAVEVGCQLVNRSMECSIVPQDNTPVSHGLNRLCRLCKPIFTAIYPVHDSKYVSGVHHEDLDSLKNAVDAGCYVCVRIWRQLSDYSATERPVSQFRVNHRLRNFSRLGFEA